MSNSFNLKYEINVDEDGKAYIGFPKDQSVNYPEHKFMTIEFTRYLLYMMLKDNETMDDLSEGTKMQMVNTINLLKDIGDQIGKMIVEQNNALDDLDYEVKDE